MIAECNIYTSQKYCEGNFATICGSLVGIESMAVQFRCNVLPVSYGVITVRYAVKMQFIAGIIHLLQLLS